MAKKMKRGRPSLSTRSETVNVTFRCTKAEKKRLQKEARRKGVTFSAHIREKVTQ